MSRRSFSLTHPEPPDVNNQNSSRYASFQERDFESEAMGYWLDTQLTSHDLDAAIAEAAEVSQRLIDGDKWMRERGPSNPDWERAQRLHNKLLNRQQELLWTQKVLYVRTWTKACAVHGCLNQLPDADAWIAKHAPGQFTNTPKSIWYAVQPKRQPPFTTYPAPVEAHYVGRGFDTQAKLTAWMEREKA